MTKLLWIATRALGSTEESFILREFREDAVYHIDDLHPKLVFGIDSKHLPTIEETEPGFVKKEPDFLKKEKTPSDLFWMSWCPVSKKESGVSAERRFGYYEAELTGSWQGRLRCYVWPAKLFNQVQMMEMLRDLREEFGRPILWERTTSPVRAYVTTTPGGRLESKNLLDAATADLRAIDQLHHMRVLGTKERSSEADDDLWEPEDTPEERLVALWALRRLEQIADYKYRLDRTCAEHKSAIQDYVGNEWKADEHEKALENAKAEMNRTVRLAATIRGVAERYSGVRAGFELVPSMQRDHRLRRLLAAFAPAKREWIADRVTRLSTLPPLKAPDFFELWGAVKIVASLRSLGWLVGPPKVSGPAEDWGIAGVRTCRWEGSKDDERILFEFGPRPRVNDLKAIPQLHERSVSAFTWAASQLSGFEGLYSLAPSTPDYALRWWSNTGRMSLAIGDASLADPAHQKGEKVSVTTKYRREIAWRASENRLVNCSPAGSFLVLPGPAERWAEMAPEAAKQDCYLLCPTPSYSSADFTHRLECLLQSLRQSLAS